MRYYKKIVFLHLFYWVSIVIVFAQQPESFMLADSAYNPMIKIDQQNRIHAVWNTTTHDGAYYGIFDTLGQIILEKRRISNNGSIRTPSLALSQNHAVAAWSFVEPTWNAYIKGQILPFSGDSSYENIQFNDAYFDALRFSPDITYLNDSTFIVVWSGDGPDTPNTGVYGQIVTNSGQFIGNNLLLTDYNPDGVNHSSSRIVSDPVTGDFTVIWQDDHNGHVQLYGRFFYSDGMPKDSSFLISDNPQLTGGWNAGLARSITGEHAVVWEAQLDSLNGAVQLWRIDSNGLPISSSIQVNSSMTDVTNSATVDVDFDEDGTFVVAWHQYVNDIPKIFVQRFLADGSRLGYNFRIATEDDSTHQDYPSVVLKEGQIYIAWQSAIIRGYEYSSKIFATIIDFYNPQVAVDNDHNPIPQEFYLYQNYPNPFNNETVIRFGIHQLSRIRIDIYDILGRKITELVNNQLLPGIYNIGWNGTNKEGSSLPSGVYICQLKYRGKSTFIKIMLIR